MQILISLILSLFLFSCSQKASRSDIVQVYPPLSEESSEAGKKSRKEMENSMILEFKKRDRDHSQRLEKSEHQNNKILLKGDKDRDGQLLMTEFLKSYDQVFDKADIDDDDFLSIEEEQNFRKSFPLTQEAK